MKKRYYLAYGSNLNLPQMKMRCPTARVVGTAMIDGYELLFKGSKTGSYLTIEKAEGGKVPVAVWEVREKDEAALDRYEGYPAFYYKVEMPVTFKGIKTRKERKRTAFVYIMHEDRSLGFPSRHYVETCMAGYNTFGFDDNYLWDAIERSR